MTGMALSHEQVVKEKVPQPVGLELLANQIKALDTTELERSITEAEHQQNRLAFLYAGVKNLTRELSKFKECPACERPL